MKCIAVALLFFATAIASFAWFTNNQNVKNKNIQMGIHSEDAQAIFYVYKYDVTSEVETVDVQTCITSHDDVVPITLDFNQYDTVFVDRNKYTPIIIRVDVEGTNLFLSNNETGTVSFNVIRTHTAREEGKYYTSDILRFTTVYPQNIASGSNYNVELYKGFLDDYYDDTKNATAVSNASLISRSFTFSNDSTSTNYNEIVITSSYTNNDLVALDNNNNEDTAYRLSVYLFLSYDEVLITEYTGSSIGFGSQELDFLNDLTLINVKNDKQGGNS